MRYHDHLTSETSRRGVYLPLIRALVSIGGISILSALADLLFPLLLGLSIDRFLEADLGRETWVIFWGTLASLFLSPLLLFFTLKIEAAFLPQAISSVRHSAWLQQQNCSLYTDVAEIGQLRGSALTSLAVFVESDLSELVYILALTSLSFLFLAHQSPILASGAILAVLITAGATHLLSPRIQRAEQEYQEANGQFLRAFEVPSRRRREFFNPVFNGFFRSVIALHSRLLDQKFFGLLTTRAYFVPIYDITAAVVFTSALVFLFGQIDKSITAGEAVTLLLALEIFLGSIAKSGKLFSALYRFLTDLRVAQQGATDQLGVQATCEFKFHPEEHRDSGLIFENVSLRALDGRTLASNLNCTLKIGSVLALAGPNGSGKTTLLDVICGLTSTSMGSITYSPSFRSENGVPMVYYCSQESSLVPGGLIENIFLGTPPTHSRSELVRTVNEFFGPNFFPSVPESFEGWSNGEVGKLSKGQVQVITFLRAFFSNSPVLLLDEICSHIDDNRFECIVRCIRRLRPHGIVITATHRQKLIDAADQVLLLGSKG